MRCGGCCCMCGASGGLGPAAGPIGCAEPAGQALTAALAMPGLARLPISTDSDCRKQQRSCHNPAWMMMRSLNKLMC